ncbi:MAG: hypothetical protein ACK5X3_15215 [Pseudomonadota bacterium]|jgi:hypothetical protein
MTPVTLREAALAEQVRVMREALKTLMDACISGTTEEGYPELFIHHEPFFNSGYALALMPTAAELQAKANAEKAGLLEYLPRLEYNHRKDYWTTDKGATTWDTAEAALRAAKEASDESE